MGKIILMADAFFCFHSFQSTQFRKNQLQQSALIKQIKTDGGFWRKYDLVQFIHNPFFGYNGDAFLIALNRIKCIGMNKKSQL